MSYKIRFNYCVSCDNCVAACPVDAIQYFQHGNAYGYNLDESKCINCGQCVEQCPCDAIIVTD